MICVKIVKVKANSYEKTIDFVTNVDCQLDMSMEDIKYVIDNIKEEMGSGLRMVYR